MGTPVPYKPREEQCIGAGECITRQLTEEERRYYDSLEKPGRKIKAMHFVNATLFSQDKESEEMRGNKKPMPSKEWILEQCSKHKNKTQTANSIAKECNTAASVVFSWFKELGIDYDFETNKTVKPTPIETMQAAEQVPCSGEPDQDTNEFDGVINQESVHSIDNSEGVNPNPLSQGIVVKIKNAQYTIGNACVVVEFENERIKVTPEGLSFEEAAALVELLNDIL